MRRKSCTAVWHASRTLALSALASWHLPRLTECVKPSGSSASACSNSAVDCPSCHVGNRLGPCGNGFSMPLSGAHNKFANMRPYWVRERQTPAHLQLHTEGDRVAGIIQAEAVVCQLPISLPQEALLALRRHADLLRRTRHRGVLLTPALSAVRVDSAHFSRVIFPHTQIVSSGEHTTRCNPDQTDTALKIGMRKTRMASRQCSTAPVCVLDESGRCR